MLHQVSNLFIYEAQNKGIDLDCNIDPAIHNNLIGDPFRINQILINLVGNALKFTSQGYVNINVKLEEINNNTMKLNFNVKDTGIGISKEKQNKLFQDFSQVDASNTRKYGGSGLGLVISQKLANLMGGGISVESIEDEGSTFSFTSIVEYKEQDYKFLSQDLKDKIVLLVNNHEEIRQNIEKTLDMFSLKTISCNDAESALKILEQKSFDYIITEWELPGEDGIQFAKNVHSIYHDKDIKTVIISSFNKKDKLISAAQNSGIPISKLLVKPFSSSSLLDILVDNSDIKLEENQSNEKLSAIGKVLLVEDNEINQLVAKQNLENFGLEIHTAINGAIAVEKAKKEHFDFIFMDLQMPIMDGFEASRRIRKFNLDIPIIALSAAVMKEDLKMTQEAGMNEHLAKPIEIEKLKNVLIKYLETSIKKVANIENEVISEELEVSIDGVSMEELFHRLNNNKELSYKMLMNFANDKKDIVNELDSLNIESDEFNSLMHNLKGLSGNLSLTDVYKYSSEIYTSDNLENKIALLPKLKESLTIVIKSINEKASSKVVKKENINNFSKDDILKEIKELSHDIEEGAFITQNRKDLILEQVTQVSNEEIANKLDSYLSNFDYDNTQIILEKIIGELF